MTTEEMSGIIIETVKKRPQATFVEIVNACGDEARGDRFLCFSNRPNLIYWADISEMFIDALEKVKHFFTIHPSSLMVYLMDGGGLTLPIATAREINEAAKSGNDLKKQVWVPVVLTIK
jgi:hypothetical protein